MNWRLILLNRFVLVPGAIVVAIALWNLYVATHDHGIVTGRVVDAAGRPVAGATVSLWTYNFTTYEQKAEVKTDAEGVFRFTDNPSHRIQIGAEKPGVGRSQRIPVFLYFRAQDTTLDTPLRLSAPG
ncbi:MAG: carboxypeptidase regulatory-like domain-containing protein [Alphaproteobacteria bacterium]|nr:carboxypeptidase regulatory-like domain-containing protein [Alphaproteobacteria bacterium]MBV8407872.1 carboxypeptidase regulatory-like domain-containing protein [Alphaproteobacteria bacterium]